MKKIDPNLLQAVREYLRRKTRYSNPDGYQDDNGHWILADSEILSCCLQVSKEKRYNSHARGVIHVARMFNVNPNSLRHYARIFDGVLEIT